MLCWEQANQTIVSFSVPSIYTHNQKMKSNDLLGEKLPFYQNMTFGIGSDRSPSTRKAEEPLASPFRRGYTRPGRPGLPVSPSHRSSSPPLPVTRRISGRRPAPAAPPNTAALRQRPPAYSAPSGDDPSADHFGVPNLFWSKILPLQPPIPPPPQVQISNAPKTVSIYPP